MTTRPKSICIVTADLVGPIRNGGIGTAYANLARALAGAGHQVTILYTLGSFCEQGTIDRWVNDYRRDGIALVPLPATNVQGPRSLQMAHGVYEWLKPRRFDVVHYHEWRGVGFYAALGRRQGLCLEGAVLCAGVHSPVLWHLEGMGELADAEALEVDYMERESVAHADVVWSPSRYMLTWLREQHWRLPQRLVRPNVLPDTPSRRPAAAASPPEIVFFGRLETRKGLDLFCDALDRLVARGAAPREVTFLGKPASVAGMPSEDYLVRRSAGWPFAWRILSDRDRDGAMAYLADGSRVAVLPSRLDNSPYTVLECLHAGVPFLASRTGGIPELIRTADRPRVLFDLTADALAERLAEVVAHGLSPARLRVSAARTRRDWIRWHDDLPVASGATTASIDRPLVSVCLTHHDRPALLEAAIDSLRAQDYPRFEVVLVDDGSREPASLAYLDRLEPEFTARGWRILRQPNRYLGAARNAAIAEARGEYLLFMDDDNLAAPQEISTFVRAARRSGADILTCLLHVFQSAEPVPPEPPTQIWPFLGAAIGPGLLRNVFGDANALLHRRVFERIGGFTEDVGVGCEDWELFARAVLNGLHLTVVPEPLVCYRRSAQGMLGTTSAQANRMRALRPYFAHLPPDLRAILHLSHRGADRDRPAAPALDHVRQAVVFGSGEAGRLALDLARRCGWSVPWIVDNNPAAWNRTAHGLPVRAPSSLAPGAVDLVIVASLAGRAAIASQLQHMGFEPGRGFVHFLDPVRLGQATVQMSLP